MTTPPPKPPRQPPRGRRNAWVTGGLCVAALVMAGIAIGVAALNSV